MKAAESAFRSVLSGDPSPYDLCRAELGLAGLLIPLRPGEAAESLDRAESIAHSKRFAGLSRMAAVERARLSASRQQSDWTASIHSIAWPQYQVGLSLRSLETLQVDFSFRLRH